MIRHVGIALVVTALTMAPGVSWAKGFLEQVANGVGEVALGIVNLPAEAFKQDKKNGGSPMNPCRARACDNPGQQIQER